MQEKNYCPDCELFQRIKETDAQALKILFERYYTILCRFACRFVKDMLRAEEVVSDVFLNVWLKKDTIEIQANVKTYLYSAVKNQSLNYLKKNKLRGEELEIAIQEHPASDFQADRLIENEELEHDIEALLQKLPEQRQIIFRMNRLDGLRYKEIAEILSISVHTVQNQMVAAVKFLTEHRLHNK